jgi:hypothetical protein
LKQSAIERGDLKNGQKKKEVVKEEVEVDRGKVELGGVGTSMRR